MNYNRIHLLAAAAVGLVISTPALGQATRTWVSGTGSDANPCSRTAPCQTFAGALSKTATGGEINALDAGGFGTINITKSITIDGLGPMSSLLAANTNGIIINGAGIVVNIRNVTINGAGTTTGNGIRILQAGAVNIDNVTIENHQGAALGTNGRGITVETSTANVRVNVRNSRIDNTTNFAIHSNPTAGNVLLYVDNVQMTGGGTTAIQMRQLTSAFINDTSITGYRSGGAVATELSTVTTHISDSFFADNSVGIVAGNGGAPVTRVGTTTITGHTSAGVQLSGGTVISYGNNLLRGNTGNELPSSTELPR